MTITAIPSPFGKMGPDCGSGNVTQAVAKATKSAFWKSIAVF